MFSSQITGNPTPTTDNLSNAFQNNLGKEEFLQLLVVQLQNQDPLSPMESQEFAAQLAQFSSVEQLTSIDNNIKEGINTDFILSQTINNTLATSLIGKEITAMGNQVELTDGEPVDIFFDLADFSEQVTLTISDAAGNVVRTIEANGLSEGIRSLSWDGLDGDGTALPAGTYTFQVSATGKDGAEVTANELIRGLAGALHFENGQAMLKVGQLKISFGDVMEISTGSGA